MSHKHDHDHTQPPVDIELRVRALESLLQEKGLIDPAALDELIDTYEHKVGPRNGAQVVARAWSDPEYKRRLMESPFVRCVPATPGRYWVCRRCGTNQRPIVRVSSSTRAAFSPSSGYTYQKTKRFASGTAAPSCAIWSCLNVRQARKAGAKRS